MPISFTNRTGAGRIVSINATGAGRMQAAIVAVTDQIRAQLTTNLTAYNNAAVNDWVKVTSTEYANVANNVPGASKKGNTDGQVTTRAVSSGFTEFQFSINNNTGSALTIDVS